MIRGEASAHQIVVAIMVVIPARRLADQNIGLVDQALST